MTGTTEVYSADYERELVLGMALREAALNKIGGLEPFEFEKLLCSDVAKKPSVQCEVLR